MMLAVETEARPKPFTKAKSADLEPWEWDKRPLAYVPLQRPEARLEVGK